MTTSKFKHDDLVMIKSCTNQQALHAVGKSAVVVGIREGKNSTIEYMAQLIIDGSMVAPLLDTDLELKAS